MIQDINNRVQDSGPIGPSDAYAPAGPMGSLMPASLFQVMWRHSWIIAATAVVALVVGFVVLARSTPIYTSTSRVYVEQSGPKIIQDIEQGVMTASYNYLYTQAELIRATPIVSDAVAKLGTQQMRSLAGVHNPVEFLKRGLTAAVGKKDEIISVSFSSPYPVEAAQVVNTVVDAYVTFHSRQKRSTAAEVLRILQKEKAERGQDLSDRLHALMDYKEQNEALAFQTDQGNVILQRLERISSALTEAQLAAVEARSNYESARDMVADPNGLSQFVEAQRTQQWAQGDRDIVDLEARQDALQVRRADRLRQVTVDHPAVTALDAEIALVQQRLQQAREQLGQRDQAFAQAQLAVLQQQVLTAEEKERQLALHYEDQRKEVVGLNKQVAQFTILQSEYEQTKKLCDLLDDRIRELNITEDVGALNISILEAARPADGPSAPNRTRIMAMALVLGLMLGAGLALARDLLDQRLRNADEVTALLGAPLLGVIPAMAKKQSRREHGLTVAREPTSHTAETLRTIRTAVFFSVPKDEARVIQVTSPGPGEGKSTLVSNLGIAMAQSGLKVLILDADLRKPIQHEIFGADRKTGISSVLAGLAPLQQVLVHTSTPGLDLICAGPDVPNPAEMLGSRMFSMALDKLKTRYDRILVDSPPMAPVADASILAAVCNATVLVVRADRSTRRGLLYAKEALLSVGGRVLGSVVNDVSTRKRGYGYGYGYGYGCGYGSKYGYGYGHGYYRHEGGNGGRSRAAQTEESPQDAAEAALPRRGDLTGEDRG